MKLKSKVLGLVCAGLLAASPVASAVLIDFEGYADTTNLHGVNLGGVTLFGTAGSVEVFSNNRSAASFHSAVNSVSNLAGFVLRGVFDIPTGFVSLWAGDSGGDIDSWTLQVFDAASNSLGFAASGDWGGDPYTQLALSAAGIASFEARWTGSEAGIAWDDLQFEARASAVPEPATLALLGLALAGLGFARRRKLH